MRKDQVLAERRRIEQLVRKWAALLGLDGWWRFTHHFIEAEPADGTSQAESSADWRYRDATMTWYLRLTMAEEEDGLENLVVHELVHCLIDPIAAKGDASKNKKDRVEYVTESVARALRKAAAS